MTAVLERTRPPCEACLDTATPADWEYLAISRASDMRYLCDRHMGLFKLFNQARFRAEDWRRLDGAL